MKITFNEKLIAYLALFSGLGLSGVAIYYSVLGLTAIFAAAAIPIIIMGVVLEVSKLIATLWLKQNWKIAPRSIKGYLITAIVVLMLITSMGIFGFLSKAHNDQSLVSGDVLAKIAIYDEKIKIAKDNIDANRKALKQLDEAVDQVMARSTTEQGADKAVQVRKQQSKERTRLLQEIQAEQKKITALNEERAPIAAEVRKVEAEVGPLKYIAAFVYGETNTTLLEKSVVWVIIILVLVFDPLAVVLLLASQVSFQSFRERQEKASIEEKTQPIETKEETPIPQIDTLIENNFDIKDHPYLFKTPSSYHPPNIEPVGPIVAKIDPEPVAVVETPLEKPLEIVEKSPVPISVREESKMVRTKVFPRAQSITTISEPSNEDLPKKEINLDRVGQILNSMEDTVKKLYVQNEEQTESSLWTNTTTNNISSNESKRIAKEQLEKRIEEYVELVKSARISMTQVPEDIYVQVKSKV